MSEINEDKKPLTSSERAKKSDDNKRSHGLNRLGVWCADENEAKRIRAYAKKQPKTKAIWKLLEKLRAEQLTTKR